VKTRNGFVSNSSSSSFVIRKEHLTKKQIEKIINHTYHAKQMSGSSEEYSRYGWYEQWRIDDREDVIYGYTSMDNFNMYNFLEDIGVDMDKVTFERD